MAFTAPDNQEYFRDNTFSDIDIEIVEDVEPGKKRRGALTIPGHVTPYGVHSMVLIPFSAYCKVKVSCHTCCACGHLQMRSGPANETLRIEMRLYAWQTS